MRTTVTLEADVAARLQQVMRERGVPFKVALNDAVRAGLGGAPHAGGRYTMPASPLGVRAGVDLDRALTLAAEAEDAEIVRKLELRK